MNNDMFARKNNADWVKALDSESLATVFSALLNKHCDCGPDKDCEACFKAWLEKPIIERPAAVEN